MKTLTVIEPWASLLACGAKTLETRNWLTRFRGPVAIHASKGLPGNAAEFLRWDEQVHAALKQAGVDPLTGRIFPRDTESDRFTDGVFRSLRSAAARHMMTETRGCVLATADLIGCYQSEFLLAKCALSADELAFGDFSPGRFGFRLANVRRLPVPIPAVGALGLWEIDDALLTGAGVATR